MRRDALSLVLASGFHCHRSSGTEEDLSASACDTQHGSSKRCAACFDSSDGIHIACGIGQSAIPPYVASHHQTDQLTPVFEPLAASDTLSIVSWLVQRRKDVSCFLRRGGFLRFALFSKLTTLFAVVLPVRDADVLHALNAQRLQAPVSFSDDISCGHTGNQWKTPSRPQHTPEAVKHINSSASSGSVADPADINSRRIDGSARP